MKTETRYYCGVCERWYDNAASAQECEAKPLLELPPIGCIFGDHSPGAFYANMTFAVAGHYQDGHRQWLTLWACRDTGMGDSLGTETCGGSNDFYGHVDEGLKTKHPTFKRLVKWLTEHGAEFGVEQITVWRNGKAVPLSE